MSVDEPKAVRPGLRERKKARTRATIRSVAFRLFGEQGYAETTIEQIADESEVSPSTFFRYFPTKEALVLTDDLDLLILEAFERQPEDVPVLTAFRQAVEQVYEHLPAADREFERERQQLLYAVPELKRAVMQQVAASVDMMADMVARRCDREPDDLEVRALAGAMIGAVLGVMDTAPGDMQRAMRAMRYVEEGLPLGQAVPATQRVNSSARLTS
ncbi:TetR family transcriptional regulator [Skermania sp. ID1734]|uniref:acyl-CoA-like ligand-binding transcription factor n=1 Tax=Skermania sp. ID1734 TaxID=2597516 RepID=UPI00117CDC96|nr:TetR family transcriptional regulator [Skermania sp. ID1734]TSE02050.1 TetR family transcriptional regulator [Skermania sp. ID1734]